MLLLQRACKLLGGLGLAFALPALVYGQPINSTNYYASQAGEYTPAGSLAGDQTYSSVSLNTAGGFLVWEDNVTDGDGLGISAVQLDNTFSAKLGNFRVNQQGAKDQEHPQVTLLPNGGAAFVWQSGPQSFQHIIARFLSSSNLWITGDITVNTATNYQANAAIAALTNGNVIVTWASYGQDNADGFQGVYAQILSPTGVKVGGEFRVNQFTPYNQRTPAVAAFNNGNFIVAWVSDEQRTTQAVDGSGTAGSGYNSADIYARVFNSAGAALGNEFLVNTATNICANPTVATAADGTYIIAWSQKDTVTINNSWDIFARQFSTTGTGGAAQVVNSQRYGDQYAPKITSAGTDYMVVWTSLGQDGSHEGVYGQFLHGDGSHAGGEQRINTTVVNAQKFQTVASDGVGRFLAVWSGFSSGGTSLDLYAQRFATTLQPLIAPGAPYVQALDSYTLSASWPLLQGFSVGYYELFVDGATVPAIITNTVSLWSNPNYNPASTHTFQLAYVLTDGRQSPLSPSASGTTWGSDRFSYGPTVVGTPAPDGLPDDWETLYYTTNRSKWPKLGVYTQLAPGVTVYDTFLWGANPTDATTWLKQWLTQTHQGVFLNWNTVPGGIYQVLTTTDLITWMPLGSPRFEAGTTDSLYLGFNSKGYYQIVRNRY